MVDTIRVRVPLPDRTATMVLASRLAATVRPGDIIALYGDLGAGKTTFARGFIEALLGETEVPSPTFSLVQTYEPSRNDDKPAVWHFDLYRLEDASEARELGLEEAFDEGVSLIEWPQRLGNDLPKSRLKFSLKFGNNSEAREAELAGGPRWAKRLSELALEIPGATISSGDN
jgi:tRNA threonylcarbamoyladenosine biosynthesis protein TsaE